DLRSGWVAMAAAGRNAGVLALFDVDGTLTAPRKGVTPEMLEFMKQLRQHVTVGVVGGSDLVKITEQLGSTVITDYDYVFSENGLVAHKNGQLIGTQSLKSFIGEDKLKEFINFTLHYIADLDIPIKRGTFIERGWNKIYGTETVDFLQTTSTCIYFLEMIEIMTFTNATKKFQDPQIIYVYFYIFWYAIAGCMEKADILMPVNFEIF
ncbi:hypothetical protein ACJX0J_010832, partial [Zea mays]